jgi:PilZ domain
LLTKKHMLICFGAVKNISADGAKVVFSDEIEVPDQFMMVLAKESGPRRICSVVWRKDREVGVRFLRPDGK